MKEIKKIVMASAKVKQLIAEDQHLLQNILEVAAKMESSYRNGGKVLICGNGGSAADAQHFAAELSGRFYHDRPPLNAEALHVNSSYLTAVANDYSFDEVYSRMVLAQGRAGDVFIGISTSGNSKNIVAACETAAGLGMDTVALTGAHGGVLQEFAALTLKVPSEDTPRIQEAHIMIIHIICELVESAMFPEFIAS